MKFKLSALWATVMFLYVYVDIFGFYKPGIVEDILIERVWEYDITQTWLFLAVFMMTIPSLMVFLCLALPAKVSRWTNIIAGMFYIVVNLSYLVGEDYAFYIFGTIVESLLLILIVWETSLTRTIKETLEETHESNGIHKIRATRSSSPRRG